MLRMKNVLRPRSVSDTDLCIYTEYHACHIRYPGSNVPRFFLSSFLSFFLFFFFSSHISPFVCRFELTSRHYRSINGRIAIEPDLPRGYCHRISQRRRKHHFQSVARFFGIFFSVSFFSLLKLKIPATRRIHVTYENRLGILYTMTFSGDRSVFKQNVFFFHCSHESGNSTL